MMTFGETPRKMNTGRRSTQRFAFFALLDLATQGIYVVPKRL